MLKKAVATNKFLIAVYVFDTVFFQKQYSFVRTGKFRTRFLIETLVELEQKLSTYNIPLFVYTDVSSTVFKKLQNNFIIENLVYQEDNTFDEIRIENKVLKEFSNETQIVKVNNQYLYNPEQIDQVFKNGIPKSFSSFRKKVEKKLVVQNNVTYQISSQEKLYDSELDFPSIQACETPVFSAFPFKGGEDEALKRIDSYFFKTQAVKSYKFTRNQLLGLDYSTKFSSWLANGSVSAKTVYWKLIEFENKIEIQLRAVGLYL